MKAADIAPEPIAGDSVSLHRLIRDLEEPTDRRYAVRPVEANRRLAEALFADGALVPRREIESQIFRAPPTPEKVVRFLPRDRLLSPAEKAIAQDCFAHVVYSGEFTSGPRVEAFEAAFAEFAAVPHVVATGSGTDGLIIALRALGVGPGDEVIMPANSFAATENAVLACGAVPVLADVRLDDHTLDAASVDARITPRTRAVVPVHLYGKLADMDALCTVARRRGVAVVEDACQAVGVTGVGARSDAAVMSFNPFKNFGLCGKAGAILTRDPAVARRCQAVGYHGFAPGQKNVKTEPFGINSRIDNTMASIAMGLLPFLSLHNFKRAYLARRYLDALAPLARQDKIALPAFSGDHSWHLFPIQVLREGRDVVRTRLLERGVETDVFYPILTHHQSTPLRAQVFHGVRLPNTERLHARVVHLPLYQHLSLGEQDRVTEALHAAVQAA